MMLKRNAKKKSAKANLQLSVSYLNYELTATIFNGNIHLKHMLYPEIWLLCQKVANSKLF